MGESQSLVNHTTVLEAKYNEIDTLTPRNLEKPPKRVLFELPNNCKECPEEVMAWARWYLADSEDRVLEFHKTRGEKSDSYERFTEVKLPTIEGLARTLNVTNDTVKNWAKKFPEFNAILVAVKEKQKQALIIGGLSGSYNGGFAKFMLSAQHGMREGVDITSNGNSIETFGMGHEELSKRDIVDITPDNAS